MKVTENRISICGWPTDVVAIDHCVGNSGLSKPHTLLFFVPGNPGVIHWYIDFLFKILQNLGDGFAVRGVSYAGHGVGDGVVVTNEDHSTIITGPNDENIKTSQQREDQSKRKNMNIAWTMDGQVKHKIEWIDKILLEWENNHSINPQSATHEEYSMPRLIFISHSIGAHLVQCLLLERPDILARTWHIIHLMPFFRFDPPFLKKAMLSTVARHYTLTIPIMTNVVRCVSLTFPRRLIELCMEKIGGVDCDKGRKIAMDVFCDPKMVRNHLVLGTQEVRELPEFPNDVALRLIGEVCSTSILFCGCPDQWAPLFHLIDLQQLQARSEIPSNIDSKYLDELRHDFVVHPEMIEPVVQFCVRSIEHKATNNDEIKRLVTLTSRL